MTGEWITEGFEAFRRGTFGNAGQDLYVSRSGILQRIHLFDLNHDGWVDLIFCNSQEHWESPPAYVYSDVLGERHRVELPSQGSPTGVVADLTGSGHQDLVLGMESNGARTDLNAFVYFGSPEGLTERYHTQLPALRCTSAAAGDFNGDGRCDLAFITEGKLRIFYQTELGFEAKRFVDLAVEAEQIAAADLDGDGYADLYLLRKDAAPCILWGSADGIDPDSYSTLPVGQVGPAAMEEVAQVSAEERVGTVAPLAKIVDMPLTPYLFVPMPETALLVPVGSDRRFGPPIEFGCPHALSVAAGDINGDGHLDLVFAARDRGNGGERSWVYWGGSKGFSEDNRTPLPADRACDVAVGDLNGNGCDDVVLCRNQSATTYSINSLVYRGGAGGVNPEPVRLPTEGARRVFVARTSDAPLPQVIFVNRFSRGVRGDLSPTIFWGGSEGFSPERTTELSGIGSANALACDFNDDGWPDVAIANSAENAVHLDPGSFIFAGGSDGFRREPEHVLPTKHAWGIAAADLNRDGYLDLVVSCFDTAELLIFWGNAAGFGVENPQRLSTECDGVSYRQPRRICLADLNNNGWLDIILSQVAEDRCFIFWGGPDGYSSENRRMLPVIRGSSPQAADLTGNGYLDLIIGSHKPSPAGPHDSFIYIYWNGPEGLREDRRTQLPANAVLAMAIADFNNDGYLDIFAGSYHNSRERDIDSYIYWGGPGAAFSARQSTRLPTHSVSGCLAADFNEDGWIDLAICNHKTFGDHRGESFVLWNGPRGFDLKRNTRLPTTGSHGMIYFQPGNQADRGPEEFYTSEAFRMPDGPRPQSIDWEAEMAPKTWVRARVRLAATREQIESAPWQRPEGKDGFGSGDRLDGLEGEGPWVQYRLALGAVNGGCTPRVNRVRLSYA